MVAFFVSSCSTVLKSSIINEQPKFSNNEYVLVLPLFDEQLINGIKVGSIKSMDNGIYSNCTYPEVIFRLKNSAKSYGANIIRITRRKKAGYKSSCDRIYADIYRVDAVSKYENEIVWRKDRKLKWSDFKGPVREGSEDRFKAETNCGIQYQSNVVTLYKSAKVYVQNIFFCNKSWVKPEGLISAQLLAHEQAHFDISEIYARKLTQELESKNLKFHNMQKESNIIFERIQKELTEKQEAYDRQTKHGTILNKQKEWESFVALTLAL